MCVLIFAETWNEKLKKSSLETISFGKNLANMLNSKTGSRFLKFRRKLTNYWRTWC